MLWDDSNRLRLAEHLASLRRPGCTSSQATAGSLQRHHAGQQHGSQPRPDAPNPRPQTLDPGAHLTHEAAQASIFLGDRTPGGIRIRLGQGDTLVLPAGWPHAVHTPRDSLVVGGNFLRAADLRYCPMPPAAAATVGTGLDSQRTGVRSALLHRASQPGFLTGAAAASEALQGLLHGRPSWSRFHAGQSAHALHPDPSALLALGHVSAHCRD